MDLNEPLTLSQLIDSIARRLAAAIILMREGSRCSSMTEKTESRSRGGRGAQKDIGPQIGGKPRESRSTFYRRIHIHSMSIDVVVRSIERGAPSARSRSPRSPRSTGKLKMGRPNSAFQYTARTLLRMDAGVGVHDHNNHHHDHDKPPLLSSASSLLGFEPAAGDAADLLEPPPPSSSAQQRDGNDASATVFGFAPQTVK